MMTVDEKFKNNEVFISKVFLADKAMNAGLNSVNEKIQDTCIRRMRDVW